MFAASGFEQDHLWDIIEDLETEESGFEWQDLLDCAVVASPFFSIFLDVDRS